MATKASIFHLFSELLILWRVVGELESIPAMGHEALLDIEPLYKDERSESSSHNLNNCLSDCGFLIDLTDFHQVNSELHFQG